MHGLVLAEKPSLMRAIEAAYKAEKYPFTLDFAAFHGHLMALAQPADYSEEWKKWQLETLPMIPDKFKYIPADEASVKKILGKMKAGHYDFVVNACDAEREGEHIFWSFYEANKLTLPVKRLWCSTTVQEDLQKALHSLRDAADYQHLREAAAYRAQFDWLTGMNFSRAVSLKTKKKTNLGRVVTPTLKIVVDRELEIQNFVSQPFYEIVVTMAKGGESFGGILMIPPELKQSRFDKEDEAEKAQKGLGKTGTVLGITEKRNKTKAPTLYSTTELEKDANKYFKFRASKTDAITQELYEAGYVSYPRTSCRFIPTSMVPEIPKLLKPMEKFTELQDALKLVTASAIKETTSTKTYVDDSKLTDHHAIIPTTAVFDPDKLSADQRKIYLLIAKRFLSIFLPPYVVDNTTALIESNGWTVKANGRTVIDKGYSILYQDRSKDALLPSMKKGDMVDITAAKLKEGATKPPDRYTDKTLLDAMANAGKFVSVAEQRTILKEAEGIGTPATRAAILDKLEQTGMCKVEKGTFSPTPFGMDLIKILKDRDIASPSITAEWEKKLGELEKNGHPEVFEREMKAYVRNETKDLIDKIDADFSAYQLEQIGICPVCSKPVVMSQNYYRCSNYKGASDPCKFIVSRKEVFGVVLSKTDMQTMLTGKPTKPKKLKRKDGTVFEAALIIKDGRVAPAFSESKQASGSIDPSKIKRSPGICKCPICQDGEIFRGKRFYLCSNKDKGCGFLIGQSICSAEITPEDIKQLVAGKTVGPKSFVWKSGSSGTGRLKGKVENKEFKVSFDFDN